MSHPNIMPKLSNIELRWLQLITITRTWLVWPWNHRYVVEITHKENNYKSIKAYERNWIFVICLLFLGMYEISSILGYCFYLWKGYKLCFAHYSYLIYNDQILVSKTQIVNLIISHLKTNMYTVTINAKRNLNKGEALSVSLIFTLNTQTLH